MDDQKIAFQAKLYVYDLNNCAREFGFKDDEGWELNLVSNEERTSLQKRYHPMVSTKVVPEVLAELFNEVKSQLVQAKSNIQNKLDVERLGVQDLEYLVAFNPKRHR